MRYDISYGIVPLKMTKKGWDVFLVQHGAGHWGFPKGHPNEGENPKATAERELKEETGLEVVRYFFDEPLEEQYLFSSRGNKVSKTVRYFVAEADGDVIIQQDEISDSRWISLEQAESLITFAEAKKICKKTIQWLSHLDLGTLSTKK